MAGTSPMSLLAAARSSIGKKAQPFDCLGSFAASDSCDVDITARICFAYSSTCWELLKFVLSPASLIVG